MAIQIDITKTKNENSGQTLKRFQRAFRETGITREVKDGRTFKRSTSNLRNKRSALARIKMGQHYAHLRKLGKSTEK